MGVSMVGALEQIGYANERRPNVIIQIISFFLLTLSLIHI